MVWTARPTALMQCAICRFSSMHAERLSSAVSVITQD